MKYKGNIDHSELIECPICHAGPEKSTIKWWDAKTNTWNYFPCGHVLFHTPPEDPT